VKADLGDSRRSDWRRAPLSKQFWAKIAFSERTQVPMDRVYAGVASSTPVSFAPIAQRREHRLRWRCSRLMILSWVIRPLRRRQRDRFDRNHSLRMKNRQFSPASVSDA
jgi:hypothetical protein